MVGQQAPSIDWAKMYQDSPKVLAKSLEASIRL